jgi:hypothetical protein
VLETPGPGPNLTLRVHNADLLRDEVRERVAETRAFLAGPLGVLETGDVRSPHAAGHPLLEYLHATERWLCREDFDSARVEGYLLEVSALATLLRAREKDAGLGELIASMVVAEQYRHAVAVLGVAYQFERAPGVRALLTRKLPGERGRIPDLWLDGGGRPRLQVEVKSSAELQSAGAPMSVRVAERAVGKAISAARVRPAGQFLSGMPGLAVVASYEFGEDGQTVLRQAAERKLASIRSLNPLLAGVLLLDFTRRGSYSLWGPPRKDGNVTSQTWRWRITWTSRQEFVPNREYAGAVGFTISEGHLPARDVIDFNQ